MLFRSSAFGNEEWVNEGLDYYQEQMREAMQYQPDVAFEDDWDEEGFVEGISNFADWLAYTAGNVAPSLIGTIGTGGAGGALVGGTVLGGKAASKAVSQYFVKKKACCHMTAKKERCTRGVDDFDDYCAIHRKTHNSYQIKRDENDKMNWMAMGKCNKKGLQKYLDEHADPFEHE
mgnify:CR=1 FL=1